MNCYWIFSFSGHLFIPNQSPLFTKQSFGITHTKLAIITSSTWTKSVLVVFLSNLINTPLKKSIRTIRNVSQSLWNNNSPRLGCQQVLFLRKLLKTPWSINRVYFRLPQRHPHSFPAFRIQSASLFTPKSESGPDNRLQKGHGRSKIDPTHTCARAKATKIKIFERSNKINICICTKIHFVWR